MHLAGGGGYLVRGQINIVSSPRRHAPGGGKLAGNRTDGRVL